MTGRFSDDSPAGDLAPDEFVLPGRLRFLSRGIGAVDLHAAQTVAAGLITQGLLVISGVLVARALGPHDRGQVALMTVIALALNQVIALGLPAAVVYKMSLEPGAARRVFAVLRPLIYVQAVASVVLPALTLFLVFRSSDALVAALISIPVTAASLTLWYSSAVFQGIQDFRLFSLWGTIPYAGYVFATVCVYFAGYRTVSAFVLAWALPMAIAAAASTIPARRNLPNDVPGEHVSRRELAEYGLKGHLGHTAPLESFQIDQMVVAAVVGPAGLGIYVVGAAFTVLPRILARNFGIVVFPRVAKKRGDGARNVAFDALVAAVAMTTFVVVVLEATIGALVPFFFGDAFLDAVVVGRVLLLCALLQSVRRVAVDIFRAVGQPSVGTRAEMASWIVFGVSVVPFVNSFGTIGAAWSMTLSAFTSLFGVGLVAFKRSRR